MSSLGDPGWVISWALFDDSFQFLLVLQRIINIIPQYFASEE